MVLNYLYLFFTTFWRDLNGYLTLLRVRFRVLKALYYNSTIETQMKTFVDKHPLKKAFICDEREWTFKEVHQFSNQIANYFTNQGLKPGDIVALFMPSKPEHALIWFGLSKIGVVTSLINENLKSDPLIHSITCVQSKALIFDPEFENVVNDVFESIQSKIQILYFSFGSLKTNKINSIDLMAKMKDESCDRLITNHKNKIFDPLCYIYTSGTTGYPKASIFRHLRLISIITLYLTTLNLSENDVIYTSLPLYHLIGLGTCVFSLYFGRTVVIRKKFSASKFWEDCIKYDCTVASYIGEVTSYLLAQPTRPTDKSHKVSKMYGVGFRGAIWKQFVDRFQVKTFMESYGSTEGNSFIFNVDGKEGACGFVPICSPNFLRKIFFRATFIKVDVETGDVVRNSDGLCLNCGPGESGMIVGKIVKNNPLTAFDGYTDQKETEKKIIRDVFEKGDEYFVSGDVLYMDELGYIYFTDRLGDTFRWKGETVSTNQVEDIVRDVLNIVDCVVFGVEIPNSEGKAGMAAITSQDAINFNRLYTELQKRLPKYAIPIFIRILSRPFDLTGTIKFSKVSLKQEGYDLNASNDEIYMIDNNNQSYVKFDRTLNDDLKNGRIKL